MLKDHHWYAGGVGAVFGAITIVIAAFLLVYWKDITTALTPQPENFTELFFENHLELPKIVSQGEPHEVSFTIHNVEHKEVEYPIEVFIEDASSSGTLLYSTTRTLAHDESVTVPVTYLLPVSVQRRDKIVVKLVNLNQTIHFWVQSDPPRSPPSASPSASATPSAILQPL